MDLDLEELWDVKTAATHARVHVMTISKWIERGHLVVAERDDRGRPKFHPLDVARAEAKTRKHAGRIITAAA
jgi:hypothetical protein